MTVRGVGKDSNAFENGWFYFYCLLAAAFSILQVRLTTRGVRRGVRRGVKRGVRRG